MKSLKISAVLLPVIFLMLTMRNASAGSPTEPLAVTVTVVAACAVSVPDTILGNFNDLITGVTIDSLNLVRGRCDKFAVWRVDVDSGTSDGIARSNGIASANARTHGFYTHS